MNRHLATGTSLFALWALAASPALAEAKTYVIDSGHTHIMFAVERFGYADTIGIFPDSRGEIVIDTENPELSRVSAQVHTPTVWTGLAARDDAVRSEYFLNTEAFATIAFESTSVDLIDEDSANVVGDLTLWETTLPVTFAVHLNRIGPDPSLEGREGIGFSLTGTLSRSAFGNATAAALIGDDVEIRIEVLAHEAD